MAIPEKEPDRAVPYVTDQPVPLGEDFAQVLSDRNIAVGADANGNVILARPDTVVVDVSLRKEDREKVASIVGRFDSEQAGLIRSGEREVAGVVTVRIEHPAKVARHSEQRWSLEAVSEFVAQLRQEGLDADLNLVVIGAQGMTGSPLGIPTSWAGEMVFPGQVTNKTPNDKTVLLTTALPASRPASLRDPLAIPGLRVPRVLVLDTGLATVDQLGVTVAHEDLISSRIHRGWTSRPDSAGPDAVDDEDESDVDDTRTLDFEAGHGTFISGIVRQICPDAEIYVSGALSSFGDGDVSSVLTAMQRSLNSVGEVDIVVMSFGGNLPGDEPGMFGRKVRELLGKALGVAAAGNQQTCRPYFPAALPEVVSVGALAADGRAWFTNFGPWIDACAPGVDVISTFFNDFVEYVDGREYRHFEKWAKWSGTSFSAPKIAALIAQEMYLYGGTAKEAWKRMTSYKHFRYPDLGTVFNV